MRLLATWLIAASCASGADVTGQWRTRDGDREITLVLEVKGSDVTGHWVTPNTDYRITKGGIAGNKVWFAIRTDFGGEERYTRFEGTAAGDELLVTREGGLMGGKKEFVAHRISREATVPRYPQDLKPLSLPPLRKLPWNGLAKTPPMGWNSWNRFNTKIDDKMIREIADALVASGMRDAGYLYINIDDGWSKGRDAQGNIQSDERFPDMKRLADYVHAKGLKLGIYSSPGPKTCAVYEGSYGHEEQDAKTWAVWGIDYLKYDWCSAGRVFPLEQMRPVFQKMGEALRKAGRPIVYSICQYGLQKVWGWGPDAGGNLWRTTGDIGDNWTSMRDIGFRQNGLEKYAAPGHWNDPDMLEVGNGGMTTAEYRTHMSLWAMLAAPLLAGNDVRKMNRETVDILTNREVIAIDQDSLGRQGYRKSGDAARQVWVKPLAGGAFALALFNLSKERTSISVRWSDVDVKGKPRVRDLWKHQDPGVTDNGYTAEVEPHGVVLLRVQQ